MKKNISINISGIIFHIEEDGYDLLKNYLDSVHRYFASYDGSEEIIADIEARAAELFMTKLKTDKQVITAEDVQTLIKTLGSIKDFQALEEEGGEPASTNNQKSEGVPKQESHSTYHAPKKLQRDLRRKKLGGVASGLANYFGMDAIWIRLMFVLLFIFWGFGLLPYIILWIAVPGADDLSEDEKLKKFYRNPDRKVLGGVASGLASYMNVDVALIRLAFLIMLIPGGVGLIVYIILWIITPEANTITEKMKMQGEPVTLSNIENRVKKEFNVEDKEESIFVRLLLFPFRAIAAVFNFIAKVLGPIVTFVFEAIRVVFGLFVTGFGLAFLVSIVVAGLVLLGFYTDGEWLQTGGIPLELIIYSVPMPIALAAFVIVFIPALSLTLGGISILSKTSVMPKPLGLSLFFFWIVAVVILAISLPSTVNDFRRETNVIETDTLQVTGNKLYIKANLNEDEWKIEDQDGSLSVVDFRIKVSEDDNFRIEREYNAFGSSLSEAEENARMISYQYQLNDSVLILDQKIDFKRGALFRFQNINVTLYVPRNRPIVLDRSISEMLESYPYYIEQSSIWMFNDTEFTCLDCPEGTSTNYRYNTTDTTNYNGFTSVDVSHFFDVTITRGETHSFKMDGTHELARHAEIRQEGNTLYIEMERENDWLRNHFNDLDERIRVNIIMPVLEEVEASGAVKITILDFDQNDMNIDLSGASNLTADNLLVRNLDIDISGASEAKITGRGTELTANLDGASKLMASRYEVKNADVDASGASKARVYANDNLNVRTSGASKVSYGGNPRLKSNRSGISDIDRE